MANSETQNVQRGIVFMWFVTAILIVVAVIYKLVKKRIDPVDEDEGGRKEDYKESQENIGSDFDKIATKKEELKEDASCLEKFFYGIQSSSNTYGPILILLPLNIITGTSKSFSLTLYFIVLVSIWLFNGMKLHRKVSESACFSAVFENLWLLLSFFFFVNHWAAMTIRMPYWVL